MKQIIVNFIVLYNVKWEQRSHTVFVHYMQRVQGHSSIIQHAQNHENITFDTCNTDYKIWTNGKGHLKVLKFQYLQAMQINRIFSVLIAPGEPNKCKLSPITALPHERSNHQSGLYKCSSSHFKPFCSWLISVIVIHYSDN